MPDRALVERLPFNIAAGNSSGYNYASGRLDHQAFSKAIRIDQVYLADVVLDRPLWQLPYRGTMLT